MIKQIQINIIKLHNKRIKILNYEMTRKLSPLAF